MLISESPMRNTPVTVLASRESITVPSRSLMKRNAVFCTAPFGATISRESPPSDAVSTIDEPSIAISFLPMVPSIEGAAADACSFAAVLSWDVAEKTSVLMPTIMRPADAASPTQRI
jgi:hypothetical protein